jgi:hypothetical protein
VSRRWWLRAAVAAALGFTGIGLLASDRVVDLAGRLVGELLARVEDAFQIEFETEEVA